MHSYLQTTDQGLPASAHRLQRSSSSLKSIAALLLSLCAGAFALWTAHTVIICPYPYLEAMLPNNFCPSVRRPLLTVQICTTIVCLSHRTRSELETSRTDVLKNPGLAWTRRATSERRWSDVVLAPIAQPSPTRGAARSRRRDGRRGAHRFIEDGRRERDRT